MSVLSLLYFLMLLTQALHYAFLMYHALLCSGIAVLHFLCIGWSIMLNHIFACIVNCPYIHHTMGVLNSILKIKWKHFFSFGLLINNNLVFFILSLILIFETETLFSLIFQQQISLGMFFHILAPAGSYTNPADLF